MLNKFLTHFRTEIFSIILFPFNYLPGYHYSNRLRGFVVGVFLKSRGKKLIINREVIIESPSGIVVGDNVAFNARCWLSGGGGLVIGDDVLIGPDSKIITVNHAHEDFNTPIRLQGGKSKKVEIKNNVWLGANVIILPGVTIHENVIVGAGSVVTKTLDKNSIYAGNPAKKISERI